MSKVSKCVLLGLYRAITEKPSLEVTLAPIFIVSVKKNNNKKIKKSFTDLHSRRLHNVRWSLFNEHCNFFFFLKK